MGYDVHITRKVNWFDRGEPCIPLEEWEAAAERDPKLSVVGHVSWRIDGKLVEAKVFEVREPGANGGTAAALAWEPNCNVSAKNPSRAGIAYMGMIAARLDGRVQGDEGEFYDERGDALQDMGR